MSPRVAVVGGGITGLAAAYHLQRNAPDIDVTVYEAASRPGGKLRTGTVGDLRIETGADAFLIRHADALVLCQQLGLGSELVEPAVQDVLIRKDGRAYPLPPGLILGAPTRFGSLFGSGLISFPGALRATLDLVRSAEDDDLDGVPVADLIHRRFGREVLERLVDPMLSGIYAGDPTRLGVAAATPRFADAAGRRRSLARGLRSTASGSAEEGSVFRSLRGGMSRLVERLAEEVCVETGTSVDLIHRSGGSYVLRRRSGDPVEAQGVIVALPAFAAAEVIGELAPDAADVLHEIPYVSVATVITVHEAGTVEVAGSGMLIPQGESRLVKAITYVSNKWPHVVGDDRVVLRSSVGRRGDEEAVGWGDERLVDAVLADLREILGVRAAPVDVAITRWDDALPQYEPGHLGRLARIDRALDSEPRLRLAGAAYGGVGVATCVRDGRRAAEEVTSAISAGGD